jgi:2,3-dihydroxybenzoate decarboxylase
LWRLDGRAKFYGVKLGRRPSDYIRDNIVVTISGMFSAEPLMCAISALGQDRIMFATDYPFEPLDEASAFIDHVALADDVRAAICADNARRLLRLPDLVA